MIGVLDSGIGGLSVLREIQALLPHENILYIADQANLPYGTRSLDEVRGFSEGITRFLLEQGAQVIVIACNTASAAALHHLRKIFPDVPFVGMEPAVRPAARDTKTGVIGIIATSVTFQGELYASLIDRFAHEVTVVARPCPELVTLAERGATSADQPIIENALAAIKGANADQLVLGCTHFAFLRPQLQSAMGEHVTIVDPAPAVARQVGRVLQQNQLSAPDDQIGKTLYLTSGDLDHFQQQVRRLLQIDDFEVGKLVWNRNQLLSDT